MMDWGSLMTIVGVVVITVGFLVPLLIVLWLSVRLR
jgi:hypothetical protein